MYFAGRGGLGGGRIQAGYNPQGATLKEDKYKTDSFKTDSD